MERKICLRCCTSFECKADDIHNCQCHVIVLEKDTRDFLAKTSYDCLCIDCLEHFNSLVKASAWHRFPAQSALVEGLHYYMEGHYKVFTELYHLLRGACCDNGCRHCVYGSDKAGNCRDEDSRI